jgi:hypothetical protein
MFKAFVLALLLLNTGGSLAFSDSDTKTPTSPVGSDLTDIARFDSSFLHEAQTIVDSTLPSSPYHDNWYENGHYSSVTLSSPNAVPSDPRSIRWRGPIAIQFDHSTDAEEAPEQSRVWVVAAAMVSTGANPSIVIRRFKVSLSPLTAGKRSVVSVDPLATLNGAENDPTLPEEVRQNPEFRKDVPAGEMVFSISAGLWERIFMMKDEQHGIRFNFPIGVGGLDPGLESKVPAPLNGKQYVNIETPTFDHARLDRATMVAHRNDQTHFRSEPFMRIMNCEKEDCSGPHDKGVGGYTAVGFHITIMSDNDYNNPKSGKGPDWVTRSFDSHGCMRLRRNDLRFIFDLAKTCDSTRIIKVRVGNQADPEAEEKAKHGGKMTVYHPWPLDDVHYKIVRNVDGHAERSPEDGLVIMDPSKKGAPLASDFIWNGLSVDQMDDLEVIKKMEEGRLGIPPVPPCEGPTCAKLPPWEVYAGSSQMGVFPLQRYGKPSQAAERREVLKQDTTSDAPIRRTPDDLRILFDR